MIGVIAMTLGCLHLMGLVGTILVEAKGPSRSPVEVID